MTGISSHFGIKNNKLSLDKNTILMFLKNRKPIIYSIKSGNFAAKIHIIILAKMSQGKIKVHNPKCLN